MGWGEMNLSTSYLFIVEIKAFELFHNVGGTVSNRD